jgi:hypothetical protein
MKSKFLAMRIIFSIAVIGFFSSCTSTGLLTKKELTSIQDGKIAIVLLRITGEFPDGTPIEPFPGPSPLDMISFGLGSFLAKGKVDRVRHRFLSLETRKKGWTYLILEPGIHYLVFQGPGRGSIPHWYRQLRYGPRFQINIPMNHQLVYVGTLYLNCLTEPHTFLGEKYCWEYYFSGLEVRDEKRLVEELTNEYLSDFDSPQTLMMQRVY